MGNAEAAIHMYKSQQDMSEKLNQGQWNDQHRRRVDDALLQRLMSDDRIGSLVALFAMMDERGKQTLIRMAQAMPKCDKEVE